MKKKKKKLQEKDTANKALIYTDFFMFPIKACLSGELVLLVKNLN